MSMRSAPWGPLAASCAAVLAVSLVAGEADAGFKLRFGSSGSSSSNTSSSAGTTSTSSESSSPAGGQQVPATIAAEQPASSDSASAPAQGAPTSEPAPVRPAIISERVPATDQSPAGQATVPAEPGRAGNSSGPSVSDAVKPAATHEPQLPVVVKVPEPAAPTARPAIESGASAGGATPPSVAPVPAAAPPPAQRPALATAPPRQPPVETVTQTSYSKRSKRPSGAVDEPPSLQAAPAVQSTTNASVITCGAGCNGSPGEVVHHRLETRQAGSALQQAAVRDAATPNVLVCVAGCYDTPKAYQAVPGTGAFLPAGPSGGMPRGLQASAGGRLVPTAASGNGDAPPGREDGTRASKSKGASGDWMTRINRERSGGG